MNLRFWRTDPTFWDRKSDYGGEWPLIGAPPPSGWSVYGGGSITIDRALGLPAFLAVLLRIGHGAGLIPQKVYEAGKPRAEARDTWQWELVHDDPTGGETTPSAFRADIALSLAGAGYACIRKYKSGGQVRALTVLDATKIKPVRRSGQIVFEDGTETIPVTRTTSDILYVRGPATGGGVAGLSPMSMARLAIQSGLKRQQFEARHYDQGIKPGIVVKFPATVTPEQAEEWREIFQATHAGPENAGKAIVVGLGADVKDLPVSLADAQYVESNQMTAEEIGAIYGVPRSFLNLSGGGTGGAADSDYRFFATFGLGWILTALDQALSLDPDIVPRAASGRREIFIESVTDALLRGDTPSRYDAYVKARQGGWISLNEIREMENYPPVEGGDVVQITPVGGAPNPALGKFTEDDLLSELSARLLQRREYVGD